MLRIYDILLRRFIALFLFILLVIGGITFYWIKSIYIDQIKSELQNELSLIVNTTNTFDNIDKFINDVNDATSSRVTLIDDNGNVLGDSHEDYHLMDNHKNRIEVLQSKDKEFGESKRYSNTLKTDLLYVSKYFEKNGKYYFLRLSKEINLVYEKIYYLSINIFIVLTLALLVLFVIALRSSKDIQKETDDIVSFLNDIETQSEPLNIDSKYSIEYSTITKMLTNLSSSLYYKNKEKNKKTKQLRRTNRQKDEIIAAISHEFKNPISVISGYSQLLLEDKDLPKSMQVKAINKVASNSKKISDLIDRLRYSLKLGENKANLQFTKNNLVDITQTVIDDLKDIHPLRVVSFECEYDEIIKDVDKSLFSIAIKNLIENALKYSKEDVHVQLTKTSFRVIDSGLGISKKDLKKITKKFYRVSTNGWNNSMGLGLSLVDGIVKLHKFNLEIKSELTKGSIFSIIFKA